ncbi:MAG: multiheme c-type cytochrome [Gemmataceae bacterium]
MSLDMKKYVIGILGFLFLVSLIFVQWTEVSRRQKESSPQQHILVPANSKQCVDCHKQSTPGIIDHWMGSTHSRKGIGCVECHQAEQGDADAFSHYGQTIATVVTPRDCSRCHKQVFDEFERSHHAKAGNILASLDNFLAETVEGSRVMFNPHSPTPGKTIEIVNGMASMMPVASSATAARRPCNRPMAKCSQWTI